MGFLTTKQHLTDNLRRIINRKISQGTIEAQLGPGGMGQIRTPGSKAITCPSLVQAPQK